MAKLIRIRTDFDGACPGSPKGVLRKSARCFVLYPGYRRRKGASEEAPGFGSRLSTRIFNSGEKPVEVCILAAWHSSDRLLHHDLGYISYEGADDWEMIPALRRTESIMEYRFTARPGTTHLGLYPEYNYERCLNFVAKLAGTKTVKTRIIGRSREGRHLWLLSFPSQNDKAKNFFIQARDHAYETAGSYCVEGIVAFLLAENDLARYIRSKFHVHIVSMTNPDGVHNGMSRLTWEQGADMNRVRTVKDAAHDALKKIIDFLKPSVHMNIHNWTDKFVDGLMVNEKEIAGLIKNHMPDDSLHFKRWLTEISPRYLNEHKGTPLPEENKSWKNYSRENFGATCATFEFPWPFITPFQMKVKGERAFMALAFSVIEHKKM